jgi:hypothetical protein
MPSTAACDVNFSGTAKAGAMPAQKCVELGEQTPVTDVDVSNVPVTFIHIDFTLPLTVF